VSVSRSPYAGASIALATLHGKERVIGRALHQGIGANLLHLRSIDTDRLGSFGPHPALPLLPVGMGWMVFLDRGRGLTVQEEILAEAIAAAARASDDGLALIKTDMRAHCNP